MTEKVQNEYNQSAIQVLERLEPVRKRPGMYISSTDVKGLHPSGNRNRRQLYRRSRSRLLHPYRGRPARGRLLQRHRQRQRHTHGIIPKENKSAVEVVLTKLHAGGKFGGGGYKIIGGLHGVGLSVVNALSEMLEIHVGGKNGKVYHQVYHRGHTRRPSCRNRRGGRYLGTCVRFLPDPGFSKPPNFSTTECASAFASLPTLIKGCA